MARILNSCNPESSFSNNRKSIITTYQAYFRLSMASSNSNLKGLAYEAWLTLLLLHVHAFV